jgi:hypothetical protein
MVQYMMRKEKDFEHLQLTLDNYKLMNLFIRPCFTGDHTKEIINLELKNENFKFIKKKDLTILINEKPIIIFPLKWYRRGFSVEYLNEKRIPAWNEYYHPMDLDLPKVSSTLLRNDLDGLLIEIEFQGKIKLKEDGHYGTHINNQYWKIIS